MADVLGELEALIRDMSPEEKAELDAILEEELSQPWLPTPGPQSDAYFSKADLLLYGGAAGGGKTDLILGLALTQHKRIAIFRRAYTDLRGIVERLAELVGSVGLARKPPVYRNGSRLIEFGALAVPGSEESWQGIAHDLVCFDEGAQLSVAKVAFVMGWVRSADPEQRCRVVIASNPPTGGEGAWLMDWFAPWLDPLFPNPAKAGELCWAITQGTDTKWVDGPGVTQIEGEDYTHESRTFIPAMLDDNPYLRETDYRARIQNMPEPLRSILLKGDFLAGRQDHEWQVIPSEWVRLANERWSRMPVKRRRMLTLAADVALGGADDTALAALHEDGWFGPIITRKGAEMSKPDEIAALMLVNQKDGADLSVDGTGGWGSGVASHLRKDHNLDCALIVFSKGSEARTLDGKLGFANLRAEMGWRFREALDPEGDDPVALPPDARLAAELTTPRYQIKGENILIESKDDIRKRLMTSTDRADAAWMALHRRKAALRKLLKADKPAKRTSRPSAQDWMGS